MHSHPESANQNGRAQRRRHAATAGRRVAGNTLRNRKPIPPRFHATAYSQQPGPSQLAQVQETHTGQFDPQFGQVEEEAAGDAEDQVCHCSPAHLSPALRRCMRVVLIDGACFFFADGLDWEQDFPVDRGREEGAWEGSCRDE